MPQAKLLPPSHHPAPWADAGCCQVVPPSTLRQIPPGACESEVCQVVASTMLELPGANRTSAIRKGRRPSRWLQPAPPLVVRQSPPLSVATIAVLEELGSTVTAKPRP